MPKTVGGVPNASPIGEVYINVPGPQPAVAPYGIGANGVIAINGSRVTLSNSHGLQGIVGVTYTVPMGEIGSTVRLPSGNYVTIREGSAVTIIGPNTIIERTPQHCVSCTRGSIEDDFRSIAASYEEDEELSALHGLTQQAAGLLNALAAAFVDPARAEPGMASLAATMSAAAASITLSNPLGTTFSLPGGSTMSGAFAADAGNALSLGFATGAFGAATGNSVPNAFNPTNFARTGGDDSSAPGASPTGVTGAIGDAPGGQSP